MPKGGAWPRSLIHKLVEGDLTSDEAYSQFTAAGGNMRSESWQRMWGEVENEKAFQGIETGRPLHLRPTEDEVVPMTTRRAKGYMQRVTVIAERSDGAILAKTIDVRGSSLVSRKNAMGKAQAIAEGITTGGGEGREPYYQAVLASFYGGTFQLSPE